MVKDDDEAWRAIVDNYGDRAELDRDVPQVEAGPTPDPTPSPPPAPPPAPSAYTAPTASWDEQSPDADWSTDRFVPPPPPPLPTTSRDRMFAWAGVFGSPAILLVSIVLGIELPQLVAYLLVAGFVGGFLYLVIKMDREPRDPDDNGAVL